MTDLTRLRRLTADAVEMLRALADEARAKVEAIGRQSNLCAALAEAIQEARRLSR
jgi:hypothetical protein